MIGCFMFVNTVSTHSRPKAAGLPLFLFRHLTAVSTHSRPKAAGRCGLEHGVFKERFNTQPPEGGWTATVAGL